MHALAYTLSAFAGAAFICIGIFALVLPDRLSREYGVPVTGRGALAFVRATGARDVALGIIVLAATVANAELLLRVTVATGCFVALGDFALAYDGAERRIRPQQITHLAGAIGFAVILLLLFHVRR